MNNYVESGIAVRCPKCKWAGWHFECKRNIRIDKPTRKKDGVVTIPCDYFCPKCGGKAKLRRKQ